MSTSGRASGFGRRRRSMSLQAEDDENIAAPRSASVVSVTKVLTLITL
jgi:hypothetical protein